MPLYDYECNNCNHQFEDIQKIKNRHHMSCPVCNSSARLLMSVWKDDWFKPFVSEDFNGEPILVKSKNHYKSLCREYGVYSRAFGHGFNISEI